MTHTGVCAVPQPRALFTQSTSAWANHVQTMSSQAPFPRKEKGKPHISRSKDLRQPREPSRGVWSQLPTPPATITPSRHCPLLCAESPQPNPAPRQTHLNILSVPLLLPGGRLALVVGGVGAQGTPDGEPGDRAGTLEGAASPLRGQRASKGRSQSPERAPGRDIAGPSSVRCSRERAPGHQRVCSCRHCAGARAGTRWLGSPSHHRAPPIPTNQPPHPQGHGATGPGSYLARAFPGGSMRVCHLEESVSRLGRMWPSRVSVSCCMSRQKMA